MTSKTLALCMIVKNETRILQRCFDSVADIIDYYVICDTGSTDGTPEFIKQYWDAKGIKGEIHHHEWKNFGYNRDMLMKVSKDKADYLLLVDADYVMVIEDPDFKSKLTLDGYLLQWVGGMEYKNTKIIRGDLEWEYKGLTHEYISCVTKKPQIGTIGVKILERYDGSNRINKFHNDLALLKQGLIDEPENERYMFYMARTYDDLGRNDEAIEWYRKRIEQGGFEEEIYFSKFRIAICMIRQERDFFQVAASLLDSFNSRPLRLEPIDELLNYGIKTKNYHAAYVIGLGVYMRRNFPKTKPEMELLFVYPHVYEYAFKEKLALCCHYAGDVLVAKQLYEDLLSLPKLDDRGKIYRNLKHVMTLLSDNNIQEHLTNVRY